ncbi:MAG: toxic anion resistance protein, partial [Lactococcus sp.]
MENPILDELINDDKVVKEAEALSETQKTELVDMHQRASLRAMDA